MKRIRRWISEPVSSGEEENNYLEDHSWMHFLKSSTADDDSQVPVDTGDSQSIQLSGDVLDIQSEESPIPVAEEEIAGDDSQHTENILDNKLNRDLYKRLSRQTDVVPARIMLKIMWESYCNEGVCTLDVEYEIALNKVRATLDLFSQDLRSRWFAMLCSVSPRYLDEEYSLAEVMIHLLVCGFKNLLDDRADVLDFAEAMSGCQRMSASLRALGLDGVALDKRYDSDLNFDSVIGFKAFLQAALFLRTRGVYWWAIECKTWIWVSRSTSLRSMDDVYGDCKREDVSSANRCMESFVFIALLLGWSRKVWVVEQPRSSLLPHAEPMLSLFTLHGVKTCFLDHGAFDSTEAPIKPLKLMGTAPWLDDWTAVATEKSKRDKLTTAKRVKLADGSEKIAYTGKKQQLHLSEHYCEAFCDSAAAKHLKWWLSRQESVATSPQLPGSSSADDLCFLR